MKNQEDVFEDFEFKPITEGLGFHPRTESAGEKTTKPNKGLEIETITKSEAEGLKPPLPRKSKSQPAEQTTKTQKAVDEILQTLNSRRTVQFTDSIEEKKQISPQATPIFKPATWEFAAGIIDFMLVIAIQIACLMIVLTVTNTSIEALFINSETDYMLLFALLTQLSGISFMYLLVSRAFLGFTAGEWVFDQRLGLPSEQKHMNYIFRVATRSLVAIITGFLVFPFLSLVFNKDVLGEILGIPLLRRT